MSATESINVHASAIVDREAVLGAGTTVGPFAVVEGGVTLGEGCRVVGGAWIFRGTTLGPRCTVYPGAVVGGPPQDFHFKGAESFVRVGADTVIREGAQVHRATTPGGTTQVGARCLIMANAHVAHDCRIGDDVVLCNGALASGHVELGDRAFVSGNVSIHQFTRMGRLSFIGGNAAISRDVPPFFMAAPLAGNRLLNVNVVGLRRAGVSAAARARLRVAFRTLCVYNLPLAEALSILDKDETPEVRELCAFVRSSKRGVINRVFTRGDEDDGDEDER